MTNEREVEFYAVPGPMTAMSRCPVDLLEGLPDDPAGLMKVARGCVVNDIMLTEIYKLPVPERNDAQIRPVSKMVERIKELDSSPLVEPRKPQRRFLGNCRHFATLSCALLRRAGTPARVRAGFAAYFMANTWVDHWIIEYWHAVEGRWVRVDPELDDAWLSERAPNMTSELLAQNMYLSGGEAWQRCRRGELDPNRFNMGGVNWGIGEIRGSVLFDLAALNQDEMLPWDCWGQMEAAYRGESGASYDELLDGVSDATGSHDFERIRELYVTNDDLRVPASLLPVDVG